MTDRPIIFSAPMVRALLAGRKTQTRRILKPQPVQHAPDLAFTWGKFTGLWPDDWFGNGGEIDDALPYAVGDRLYVREAWNCFSFSQDGEVAWPAKRIPTKREFDELAELGVRGDYQIVYAESDRAREHFADQKWRPSIHLPRWASRLTLTVSDVRVQRLQAISEEDCIAEGPKLRGWADFGYMSALNGPMVETDQPHVSATPRTWYRELWDSLHGDGAWDENPWVVALTFTVEKRNIDG